jgi:hypothetical protein
VAPRDFELGLELFERHFVAGRQHEEGRPAGGHQADASGGPGDHNDPLVQWLQLSFGGTRIESA